jgi:hypothetical protein
MPARAAATNPKANASRLACEGFMDSVREIARETARLVNDLLVAQRLHRLEWAARQAG